MKVGLSLTIFATTLHIICVVTLKLMNQRVKIITDYYQLKCLYKDIIGTGKLRRFSGKNRRIHSCSPRGKNAKWWHIKLLQITISLKAFIGTSSDLENYVVSVERIDEYRHVRPEVSIITQNNLENKLTLSFSGTFVYRILYNIISESNRGKGNSFTGMDTVMKFISLGLSGSLEKLRLGLSSKLAQQR